jgi:type I restriction enzyme S subunit
VVFEQTWKQVAAGDIAESFAIGPFGSRMKTDCYVEKGIPIIRGNNISETKALTGEFVFLSVEMAKGMPACNAYDGDLVFPHRGLIGEVGIVTGGKTSHFFISSSLMRLRVNREIADPLFYFYFYRSSTGRHELLKNASQVGTPGIATPLTSLRSTRVPLPPLAEQRAIADVLGALDDKIELNRQMNETLEALAQTLFKNWFVDAVATKPPKGWRKSRLGEHVEVAKGLSYKGSGLADAGVPLHNLNSIYEGGRYKHEGLKHYTGEYKDRHIIHPGDVIVANTEQGFDHLLIGYPAIVPKRYGKFGLFTHHIYRVRPLPNSPLTNHFIYLLLISADVREQVIGHTNGTTVNALARSGIEQAAFALPTAERIAEFEQIVAPMFEQQENLYDESRTLAELRDALLPKLLSGELRVPTKLKEAAA